jgi:predicted porin
VINQGGGTMNESKTKAKLSPLHVPISALAAAILATVCQPAFAAPDSANKEAEIENLKRELEAQRQVLDTQTKLLQNLLQGQEEQKKASAKAAQSDPPTAATTKPGELMPGVTVYGTADVNVANTNSGYGRKTTVGTGGMVASRLGVKGARDIGGDVKVIGEAEAGIAWDNGTVGNGAQTAGINDGAPSSGGLLGSGVQVFSRQAYVGLSSGAAGSLTLGRQYAGSYIAAAVNGYSMGVGFFGNGATLLPLIGGMPTRVNNSIVYKTPLVGGVFSGYLTYTVGSENNINTPTAVGATTTTDKAGQGWDLATFYRQGPFSASVSTWNVNAASYVTAGETALAKKQGAQIAANYNFGIVKVFGSYIGGKITGGNYENVTKTLSKASGWSTSAMVPLGKHAVFAAYSKLDDKSLLNKDASMVGLAYTYELYANTKLYANWGKLTNKGVSTYSLADGGDLVGTVATGGFSPSGFMVGLNANF